MNYVVEGTDYKTLELATSAANALHSNQGRAICIETGNSTQGETVTKTWIGRVDTTPPANELIERVERTERLAKRATAVAGSDPVPLLDE